MTDVAPRVSAAPPSPGTHRGVVTCAAYAGGRRLADVPLDHIGDVLDGVDGFIWIGLYEPDEDLLRKVQKEFKLHDLAIEDAHRAHQRPKLEQYEQSLFVVLRTAYLIHSADGLLSVKFGETHVFVGPRYVLTVRHGSQRAYTELRARCEASPKLLARGPGFVLYALMDFLVDQYFPIVAALEEEVATLEEQLLGDTDRVSRQTLARIYQLKRDLLTTAFEVNLSMISVEENKEMKRLAEWSVEQNRDMRRLAAWAAIIAVPTMIAGIEGMNFERMPELHMALGYPLALVSMVGSCVALFVGFKRTGWL